MRREKAEVYEQLSNINAEIRKVKSELRLCEQVQKEVPIIQNKLKEEKPKSLDSRLIEEP